MAIRVGILLQSAEVPAWQSAVIDSISDSPSTDLVFIFLQRDNPPGQKPFGWIFERFQQKDLSREKIAADPLAVTSLEHLINGHPTTEISATELLGSQSINNKLLGLELDIIITLTYATGIDRLGDIAKHGLWFYWHDYGQTTSPDGRTVGFWEVVKRRPTMKSALLVKTRASSQYKIAYTTLSGVHARSHHRTRNEHLWKLSQLMARTLEILDAVDPGYIQKCPEADKSLHRISDRKRWRISSLTILWPVLLYGLKEFVTKLNRRRYQENWILMSSPQTEGFEPKRLRPIFPPQDRFWADPDVVSREGKTFLFFEDASRRTGKGRISVMRLSGDGSVSSPSVVLSKPYHLSYPHIFEWDNEIYMIPESAENRTIDLYRFTEFPHKVEFVYSLMERIEAYDSTIFFHDDRYWLFANIRCHPGASTWDELCVFYSESPVSRSWHPHPMNPVISDITRARPAGHIFTKGGELFRPSQDSSHRYGYALNINKVTVLTTKDYQETVWRKFTPTWTGHIRGLHTFNKSTNCSVIDAIYRSPI